MEKLEIVRLTSVTILFGRVGQRKGVKGGVKKALIVVMVGLYTTLHIPWNNPVVL